MRKAIFIDFDGTLMDSQVGKIPQSSFDAIKILQKNGHFVVIATGRNLELLENYPSQLGIEYVVGSNGRFVSKEDQIIFEDPVPQNILVPLLDDLRAMKLDYTLSTATLYVTHQKYTSFIDEFSKHFKMPKPTVNRDFNNYDHIYQINIFSDQPIPKELSAKYPLIFTQASEHAYDVTHGHVLKEQGLKFIEKEYGFENQNIIAVGDGLNDIGMIQYAGIGIAMGNAKKSLKHVADYVTDSIDQDGLYKAFKAFDLI